MTTDHISPAGNISKTSPAGKYLIEHGVQPADFNSYGSRRGNDRVMIRGTFANIRIRNFLAPGTEGGVTKYLGPPTLAAAPKRGPRCRCSAAQSAAAPTARHRTSHAVPLGHGPHDRRRRRLAASRGRCRYRRAKGEPTEDADIGEVISIYDAAMEYKAGRRSHRHPGRRGIRHRPLARLGRQGDAPARRPRRHRHQLRAHPPQQPRQHGRPAAAIPRRPNLEDRSASPAKRPTKSSASTTPSSPAARSPSTPPPRTAPSRPSRPTSASTRRSSSTTTKTAASCRRSCGSCSCKAATSGRGVLLLGFKLLPDSCLAR